MRPATAPETREFVLGSGRRLTARLWQGRGTPLVALHGLLDSSEGFADLAAESDRPTVAFDLPGFGGSDLAGRPRISAYADVVVEGLDALGVERFVLLGHSLGGAVAVAVAERIPERVAALILLAPAGFGRIRLAEAISIPGVRNVVERTLPVALLNPLVLTVAYTAVITHRLPPDRALLQRVIRHAVESVPGAREGTKAVVAAGRSKRAFHGRRLGYAGPVHAVWGDHDRLVPIAHAAALQRALPQTHLEVWRGMGHHPQRERPKDLAALVEDVCGGARRRTGGSRPRAA